MKTPLFLLVLVSALGLLVLTSGCVSHARSYGRPTVALAITVNGDPPTALQFEAARRMMLPEIDRRGWILVDNPDDAERILRVDFAPDPADPQNRGKVYVLGTLPNPTRRRAVASSSYYASPYEFRDYYYYPIAGYWGYYGYYHHHDGHWSSPSGSSSGGPSTPPNSPPNQTVATPPPPPSSGRYSPPDDHPVRRGKYLPSEPVRRIDPPSSNSGYSSSSGGSSGYSGGSSSYSGGSSSYSGGSSSSYSGGGSAASSWSAPASSDSSSSSSTARNGGERVEKER